MMKRLKILVIILCACLLQVQAQALRMGAERTEKLLPLLDGKRVALVVNQTSVVGEGKTHLLDTLLALGVKVKKVFAPEHGFRGNADTGETVKNGRDVKSGLPILSTIASGAPMVGFLGTVLGMIQTFFNMAQNASGVIEISSLSEGMYQAMVTTVGGLIVGILAMFAYNLLVSRIDRVVRQLESRTMEFMDLLNEPV